MTPRTSWQPGHRFLLRVAGLPVESVRALRCPDTARWADEVLVAEEELLVRGRELSDVLHALVPAADRLFPDDGRRRHLLALRRDIFNNRLPKGDPPALDLIEALDPAVAERTGQWLEGRRGLDLLHRRGATLLGDELAGARGVLRALLDEDRLRHGLLLASPTLEGRLESYVRLGAGERPDKRLRKIERSVLSYLYRTACKTSPFSTFTGVALGTFGDGDDPSIALRAEWRGRVRLNVVVLARFAEQILASPALRADLPVRLASGWGGDDQRVRYVRRWVTTGDDDAAVTFDAVKDRLFFLRRSGTLDRLIALLSERDLRYGEVVDWLCAEYDADASLCETYVSALLQLGMIRVPSLDTDVHTADPLRTFQDALRALDRPWAHDLAGELDNAAGLIDAYPQADTAGRARLLRRLRSGLGGAQKLLGVEEPSLPQTLLYEDADAGDDVSCGLGAWTGTDGGALRSVERILPAFDLTLPQRVTLKGFFLARYGKGGRCDDLLGLVHDFHEDFFDQYLSFTAKRSPFDARGEYVPEENWLGLAEIKSLDRARRTFIDRMRALWAGHTGETDVVLDDTHLDEVAAELDGLRAPFTPQSHHLQLTTEGGEPLMVLNRSYGGLSFPFSRFTHVWDEPAGPGLSAPLREQATRLTPPGAVLAELTGGSVTTNLNLHGRLTEYQIVCPGESSSVPEDRRIQLEDLRLEHDEVEDRLLLRSERLGREVIPVYLGYLVPLALPETPRTLLLLSPTSMAPLDVWAGVPHGPAHEGVTRRPRVRHGNLVLARRGWSTTAAALPGRPAGTPDDEAFLAWRRWRRIHGLPARVFVTVSSGPRGGAGAKPQYLDFDSPLSLTAFEALVKSPDDRIELREMLPAESGLHVVSERGSHVAELSVETFTSHSRYEESAA
ncbi:lantibiotic dehydratase [Streptomyces sp. NBC_00299]|uniref:lantibiotic dehydratase n=1 Tax=Streptomyces sp. NBC_00299 TaxID=2975705 RepID=UPI002E2AC113|nr:lantibiotic dehydratase [Streptomyces sp. NBC_00299]